MTATVTFFGSLATLSALLSIVLFERAVGRRVLMPKLRVESDTRILSLAESAFRTVDRIIHLVAAFFAQIARAALSQLIIWTRQLSARLRNIAERRHSLTPRESVSLFLKSIAEHKKHSHTGEGEKSITE